MRGRLAWALLAATLVLAPAAAADTIHWRRSVAVGTPNKGALVRGVQLPSEGPDWFTWDLILRRGPNRPWRRWGTDRLVRTLVTVLAEYRAAHPEAPRVGVATIDVPQHHPAAGFQRPADLGQRPRHVPRLGTRTGSTWTCSTRAATTASGWPSHLLPRGTGPLERRLRSARTS